MSDIRTAEAAIPLGLDPAHITDLIVYLFSGQGLAAIPDATPAIVTAARSAMFKVEAHAYKIVWFAFLPGCILAAAICLIMRNPSERMNWVVDAPLEAKTGNEKVMNEDTRA